MSRADDHFAISNLMMRYYLAHDRGDLEGMAEAFAHAEVTDTLAPGAVVVDTPPPPRDQRPRQQHHMTNLLLEFSEDGNHAVGHSYYTFVLDLGGAAVPTTSGRCEDEFEKVDGEWRFTRREYVLSA